MSTESVSNICAREKGSGPQCAYADIVVAMVTYCLAREARLKHIRTTISAYAYCGRLGVAITIIFLSLADIRYRFVPRKVQAIPFSFVYILNYIIILEHD